MRAITTPVVTSVRNTHLPAESRTAHAVRSLVPSITLILPPHSRTLYFRASLRPLPRAFLPPPMALVINGRFLARPLNGSVMNGSVISRSAPTIFGFIRRCVLTSLIMGWCPNAAYCQALTDTLQGSHCLSRSDHTLRFGRVYLRRNLKVTKNPRRACGMCYAYAFPSKTIYPQDELVSASHLRTNDPDFRLGSTHLLNGLFETRYKNGRLRTQMVYEGSFLRSTKDYDRHGNLTSWHDHDIQLDGCAFSFHMHECWKEAGQERVLDVICTFVNGHRKCLLAQDAWKAKRAEWSLPEPVLQLR